MGKARVDVPVEFEKSISYGGFVHLSIGRYQTALDAAFHLLAGMAYMNPHCVLFPDPDASVQADPFPHSASFVISPVFSLALLFVIIKNRKKDGLSPFFRRKTERKYRAAADFAVHANLHLMPPRNLPHDRQPQPGAFLRSGYTQHSLTQAQFCPLDAR